MTLYDPIAPYYEADFGDYNADIHFYSEMARRTGGPILAPMCGTGRVLLPLAEQGYTLTGIDLSEGMLTIAREKLNAAGLAERVALFHSDIRSADLPTNHFAFAFVAINSFMHLERVKDQLAALERIHHTLQPDGVLVLDLFNPDPLRLAQEDGRLVLERVYEVEGRQVQKLVASESDVAAQTSTMTYLFDEVAANGQVTRRTLRFTLRWLYRYELEHLLHRTGFVLRALYGSYDLDEYCTESDRMLALAVPRRG
ncbi:MAG: methyltransferase domain-containing protein [Chloroflexaceae bacterium]|nr:methyltransferase domain-containing protein [Chloroflexaceae bacterium]NJO06927.1 methyltransferase domain-containing protein [Chloroflexaceae bacterium]